MVISKAKYECGGQCRAPSTLCECWEENKHPLFEFWVCQFLACVFGQLTSFFLNLTFPTCKPEAIILFFQSLVRLGSGTCIPKSSSMVQPQAP